MLDLSKVKTKDRKILEDTKAFVEWYNTVFPDGQLPSYEEFQTRVTRENMNVRDAWIARFYNEGINIQTDMGISMEKFVGPDIANAAKALVKEFPRASRNSPGPEKLALDIKNSKAYFGLSIDEFRSQTSGVKSLANLKQTMFGKGGTEGKIAKFLNEGRGAGSTGAKTTLGAVISDESMRAMLEGFNDIPDDDVREMLWVGSFGARGEATVNIAINKEIAVAAAQSDQYWDPVNKVLVATDTGTRKGLPPSRKVDPITEEILDRRWQAAVDAGETRLFPDDIADVKKLSSALQKYVFPKITGVDQTLMGKELVGITDLRKVVGSWMLKTLGQGDKIDQLLSHTEDTLDEAARISRVGRTRYLTIEGDTKVFQDFLNRAVQSWAKLLDVESIDKLPAKMGLNATVSFDETIPFFDFDETDIDAGNAVDDNRPQGTPKSDRELELEAKERESGIVNRTSGNLASAVQKDLEAEQKKKELLRLRTENIEAEENLPPPPERIATVSDDTKVAAKKGFGRLANRLQRLGGRAGKKILSVVPGVGAGLQMMDAESKKQELMATGRYTEQQVDDYLRNKIVYGETPAGLYSDVLEGAEAVKDIFSDVSEEEIKKRDLERMESQMKQIGIQAGPEA